MQKMAEKGPLDAIFEDLNLAQEEAEMVEKIMREEIFHSTLDWQSEEQLLGAAIRAHDLFRRSEGFYRASRHHSKAQFELAHLRAIGADPDEILKAARNEETARKGLNHYLEYPLPALP